MRVGKIYFHINFHTISARFPGQMCAWSIATMILHNFMSKKSRNGLLEVKLQYKVRHIFRRREIFRRFIVTTKRMLRIYKFAFVNTLCLPLLFEKYRRDKKIFQTLWCYFTYNKPFRDFLDIQLCRIIVAIDQAHIWPGKRTVYFVEMMWKYLFPTLRIWALLIKTSSRIRPTCRVPGYSNPNGWGRWPKQSAWFIF